jgi:hypothetical protein
MVVRARHRRGSVGIGSSKREPHEREHADTNSLSTWPSRVAKETSVHALPRVVTDAKARGTSMRAQHVACTTAWTSTRTVNRIVLSSWLSVRVIVAVVAASVARSLFAAVLVLACDLARGRLDVWSREDMSVALSHSTIFDSQVDMLQLRISTVECEKFY